MEEFLEKTRKEMELADYVKIRQLKLEAMDQGVSMSKIKKALRRAADAFRLSKHANV